MNQVLHKPKLTEYPAYYENYLKLLPETEIFDLLQNQAHEITNLLQPVSEEQAAQPYAEGKWSLKELLGHLTDTERIFAYRALCMSRGELQDLPGFNENEYVTHARFNNRTLKNLLSDYNLVRQCSISLYSSFDEEMLSTTGLANGQPMSVRAIVFVTAAHERHHLNVIKERYLVGAEQ